MGDESRAKRPKAEVIHRRKFMQGRMTPEELNTAVGIRKPCHYCGRPGQMRIRTFMSEKDAMTYFPQVVAMMIASSGTGQLPTVPMTYGRMVRMTDLGVCLRCRPEAEKQAAKLPSKVLVEIVEPPKTTIQSQVPR